MEVQPTRAGTRHPGVRIHYIPSDRQDLLVQRFAGAGEEPHILAPPANAISAYLFRYLNGYRIPTHFIELVDDTASLVRRLEMFPVKVRVWNVAAAGFARRLGLEEATELPFPVPEYHYGSGERSDSLVNEFHLHALGAVTPEDLRLINRLASKTNAVLRSHLSRRGVKLLAVTCAFGTAAGQIMLGGELTPDVFLLFDTHPRTAGSRDPLPQHTVQGAAAYRLLRERLLERKEGGS